MTVKARQTLPQQTRPDDQQLASYVLGLLPEEDAERLDQFSIEDDEVAWRLRLVEYELIDGYVRRTLTRETAERFESHYLASPRRCANVGFAASFLAAVDRAALADDWRGRDAGVGSPKEPEDDPAPVCAPPRKRAGSTLVWTLSAVAATLMVGAVVARFEGNRGEPQREQAAAASPLVSAPFHDKSLPRIEVRQFDQARRPASAAAARGGTARTALARPVTAVALVLAPQMRGIGEIPALALPADARDVAFQLQLETNDFPRYQVGLRDPAVNRVVWRSGWMPAHLSTGQTSIAVLVPASLLKTQHYSLDLNGPGASGGAEVIGSYAFQIVPR